MYISDKNMDLLITSPVTEQLDLAYKTVPHSREVQHEQHLREEEIFFKYLTYIGLQQDRFQILALQ